MYCDHLKQQFDLLSYSETFPKGGESFCYPLIFFFFPFLPIRGSCKLSDGCRLLDTYICIGFKI